MTSAPTIGTVDLRGAGSTTVPLPRIGLGVFLVPEEQVGPAVTTALEVGYRLVDTAALYGNEAGVGRVLASRPAGADPMFVTTKLWNTDHRRVRAAYEASLAKLGLDLLDLYLIHWPVPQAGTYVEAWRELLALRDEGRVRAVGVCNFTTSHLQRLADETGELPTVNQLELHPYLQQAELRAFHAEHGIVTESWSPLARGRQVLGDPVVADVARKHGVTPAQAILRWHLDLGCVVIPKSVTPSRIRENIDIGGFRLDEEDLERFAALDRGMRIGPDPDRFHEGAAR